jgi:A/G-specific adenine glycosylase
VYETKDQKSLLYTIWLSEILLQQTQAERVIPFLEKILQRFPTMESLAKTEYDIFFPYYKGLWYYSRARNILKTAKIVYESYDSIFPTDEWVLKKLPWIWAYTASAIRWFGYGIPVLTWDTNLEKVFSRYIKWRKDIKLEKNEKIQVEESFRKFIDSTENNDERIEKIRSINNALMDFSRLIDDKNRENIDWDNYPIQSGLFYQNRWIDEPKVHSKIQRFPTADAHIVVILHENHRVYYSNNDKKYTPYILQWVWVSDTRQRVQSYFLENYHVELSVRPIHKKWMGTDNIAYIAVYAQVQSGNMPSKLYKKEEILPDLLLYKK